MNLSPEQLEAEMATVLPPRNTLFTFTNELAFVWAPSTAVVIINHSNFSNATAGAGAMITIVQTAS